MECSLASCVTNMLAYGLVVSGCNSENLILFCVNDGGYRADLHLWSAKVMSMELSSVLFCILTRLKIRKAIKNDTMEWFVVDRSLTIIGNGTIQ